jgi:N-methylhydantoinase B
MEQTFPVIYNHYALHEGSAGAGKMRGGFGLDYKLELRNGEALASFVMDHGRFGPQGALGGNDGDVNKVVILRNGSSYVPKHLSKEQDITLAPGDRVWVRTPGGGGYGDPLQRPVDAVREDVRLERYSLTDARDLYGVVLIKNDNVLCVDEAETAKLRVEMKRSF